MTTPLDIVTMALKDAGVLGLGQTPNAEDTNDAFRKLNWMLAKWARKRLMIWHQIDRSVVTTGAQSYSIGPGGDVNMPQRPDRLLGGYFLQVNVMPSLPISYPMTILAAREDYNRITLKTLGSWPQFMFYDPGYPLGTLYPWPIPQAAIFEIHVTMKEVLSQFSSLAQVIVLPPEYEDALESNLAVRLCPGYSKPVPPDLLMVARDGMATIRNANLQLPMLTMPPALAGRGGSYNFYSDSDAQT